LRRSGRARCALPRRADAGRPQAARARARAVDRAARADARRGRRRAQLHRGAGVRGADPAHPRRARHLGGDDRARDAGGDEPVGPRDGARSRQADRRGYAEGGRQQSAGDHRVPGHGDRPRSRRVTARAPGVDGRDALLEVDRIDVFYDDVQVLYGLSFAVRRGEIVTLLGSNGAGKTTTLRAITGLVPPRAGEIRFRGQSLAGVPAAARAELGMALVPEGRELWPQLTVLENL